MGTIRRDEEVTFFVDACLGSNNVPTALRAAGAKAECLVTHFPPDAPDVVWLPEVGRRGWAVLTKDKWILRRATEIAALRASGVAAFILSGNAKMNGDALATAFVTALPRMRRMLASYARGGEHYFIAKVSPTGEVKLIDGGTRWGSVKRN